MRFLITIILSILALIFIREIQNDLARGILTGVVLAIIYINGGLEERDRK